MLTRTLFHLNCFRSIAASQTCSAHSFHRVVRRCASTNVQPTEKATHKKPKDIVADSSTVNRPFVKNLFLGQLERTLLSFPEFEHNRDLDAMKHKVEPIEKVMALVDPFTVDSQAQIPEPVFSSFKEIGLFGFGIPTQYGGKGLDYANQIRIYEALSANPSMALTIACHHELVAKVIAKFGSEEQKSQFLPRLASGQSVGAFCLAEANAGNDVAGIESEARASEDELRLFGTKRWVTNGNIADIFIVFVKMDSRAENQREVTAVIVDKQQSSGVTCSNRYDTVGCRGTTFCDVVFDNVPVPRGNVLSHPGEGLRLAMQAQSDARLVTGAIALTMLRNCFNYVVKHVINRRQFNRMIGEFGMVQHRLARVELDLYAAESMLYLTSGIHDSYSTPDCLVENAVVKVFASEAINNSLAACSTLLGGDTFLRGHPLELLRRDASALLSLTGSNDMLRSFISLGGCQHAGLQLISTVRKMRNWVNHPAFMFRKLRQHKAAFDDPPLEQELWQFVHPSLTDATNLFEKRLLGFRSAVEHVLSQKGNQVVDAHFQLQRMADVVIQLWAQTAVLSRASRAYSIGLPHNDHELQLAHSFVFSNAPALKGLLEDLFVGEERNGDENLRMIAEKAMREKSYPPAHALERNY